ncbi:MAG: tyrosine--tRNA ligase, partial [Crenarchaeota archaeon]|nr:tyrosine--tRNA ligase [Thermoproteota archaeon]
YLNDKGPLELLQDVSVNYWIPVLRALGVNSEYILGSEFQGSQDYIYDLFTLARFVTVHRAIRAVKMILRHTESISVAASLYPIMQVLDIVHLEVNLAIGGTDQRKIHALARDILHGEVSSILRQKVKKTICIHLPMVLGLKAGEKMSSSKPETHIAVHDKPETINKKLQKAYCPPTTSNPDENPIFSILAYIIFPYNECLRIDRPEKYGGPVEYRSLDALGKDFLEGKIHPLDLKNAIAELLIQKLEPVRRLLEKDPEILRPLYRLQKWNFEKGYINKESWEDLKRSYQQWLENV